MSDTYIDNFNSLERALEIAQRFLQIFNPTESWISPFSENLLENCFHQIRINVRIQWTARDPPPIKHSGQFHPFASCLGTVILPTQLALVIADSELCEVSNFHHFHPQIEPNNHAMPLWASSVRGSSPGVGVFFGPFFFLLQLPHRSPQGTPIAPLRGTPQI